MKHRSATRGFLWMATAGAVYSLISAMLRGMALELSPFLILAMVYIGSILALLPLWVARGGRSLTPLRWGPILVRGLIHWFGMSLWLFALAHLTLAESTAIGFSGPLFISAGGAALLLKEPMRWERVAASMIGFGGVLVVLQPRLAASQDIAYALLMLASTAVFAVSFLLAKRLTLSEKPGAITVCQSLVVTVCSVPLAALSWTPPSLTVVLTALACGVLTLIGNYCFARAFSEADISATQPARFLDLVWAAILGGLMFGDRMDKATWIGSGIIFSATIWAAHRERVGT
jgi:drug/metabolite transporter (DMT)-like permease